MKGKVGCGLVAAVMLVVGLCSLVSAMLSALSSAANSLAMAKMADAVQAQQTLTWLTAVLALAAGIGICAMAAAVNAAVKSWRQRRQVTDWQLPWGQPVYRIPIEQTYPYLPGIPQDLAGYEEDHHPAESIFDDWV